MSDSRVWPPAQTDVKPISYFQNFTMQFITQRLGLTKQEYEQLKQDVATQCGRYLPFDFSTSRGSDNTIALQVAVQFLGHWDGLIKHVLPGAHNRQIFWSGFISRRNRVYKKQRLQLPFLTDPNHTSDLLSPASPGLTTLSTGSVTQPSTQLASTLASDSQSEMPDPQGGVTASVEPDTQSRIAPAGRSTSQIATRTRHKEEDTITFAASSVPAALMVSSTQSLWRDIWIEWSWWTFPGGKRVAIVSKAIQIGHCVDDEYKTQAAAVADRPLDILRLSYDAFHSLCVKGAVTEGVSLPWEDQETVAFHSTVDGRPVFRRLRDDLDFQAAYFDFAERRTSLSQKWSISTWIAGTATLWTPSLDDSMFPFPDSMDPSDNINESIEISVTPRPPRAPSSPDEPLALIPVPPMPSGGNQSQDGHEQTPSYEASSDEYQPSHNGEDEEDDKVEMYDTTGSPADQPSEPMSPDKISKRKQSDDEDDGSIDGSTVPDNPTKRLRMDGSEQGSDQPRSLSDVSDRDLSSGPNRGQDVNMKDVDDTPHGDPREESPAVHGDVDVPLPLDFVDTDGPVKQFSSLEEWAAAGVARPAKTDGSGEDLDSHDRGENEDAPTSELLTQQRAIEQTTTETLIRIHRQYQLKDLKAMTKSIKLSIPGTSLDAWFSQLVAEDWIHQTLPHTSALYLSDHMGLGKTVTALISAVFIPAYRLRQWEEIQEEWEAAKAADEEGTPFERHHLPEDHQGVDDSCPWKDKWRLQCPCEPSHPDYGVSPPDGWTLIVAQKSNLQSPWINELHRILHPTESRPDYVNNGFGVADGFRRADTMGFEVRAMHTETAKGTQLVWDESKDLPHVALTYDEESTILSQPKMSHRYILITTPQSWSSRLDASLTPAESRHSLMLPRITIVDEAHLYHSADAAAPGKLRTMARKLAECHEHGYPVREPHHTHPREWKRADLHDMPCSTLLLLTGTPFNDDMYKDMCGVWFETFQLLDQANGLGRWHETDSNMHSFRRQTQRKLAEDFKTMKSTASSIPVGIKREARQRYLTRVAKFAKQLMIQRTNESTLWGEEIVKMPPLTTHQVQVDMTAAQAKAANAPFNTEVIAEIKAQARSKGKGRSKDGPAVFTTWTNISRRPALSVFASIPHIGTLIEAFLNDHPNEEPLALTSDEMKSRGWTRSGLMSDTNPYRQYCDRVVPTSHKWPTVREWILKVLSIRHKAWRCKAKKGSAGAGFGRIVIATRSQALCQLLFHYIDRHAKADLETKLGRKVNVCVLFADTPDRDDLLSLFNDEETENDMNVPTPDILVVCTSWFGTGQSVGRASTIIIMEPQANASLERQVSCRNRRAGGTTMCYCVKIWSESSSYEKVQMARNTRSDQLMEAIMTHIVNESGAEGDDEGTNDPIGDYELED